MDKKLIIGLGNPGEKYANTRHNAGEIFVNRLQSTVYSNANWEQANKLDAVVCRPTAVDMLLAKQATFMNESGKAVKKLVDFYKVATENLYVAYDDLDIPLGSYKIVRGKGPKIHNGVESVKDALGTEDFWHVRIGIDNRVRTPKGNLAVNAVKEQESGRAGAGGKEYVLQDFTKEERKTLADVLERIRTDIYGRL